MKDKIRRIHSELNDGRITVSQATEQVLDLLAVSGSIPHPEEILTDEQIQNTLSWYDKHRNHVNSLVNGVSKFPPSLSEDKRDCRLWKPQHWNWFLGYYH